MRQDDGWKASNDLAGQQRSPRKLAFGSVPSSLRPARRYDGSAEAPRRDEIRRPLRAGDAETAEKLLQQGLARFGRDFVEARFAAGAKQELVAGRELIDEAQGQRFASEPHVAVGDLGDVDARPALREHGP